MIAGGTLGHGSRLFSLTSKFRTVRSCSSTGHIEPAIPARSRLPSRWAASMWIYRNAPIAGLPYCERIVAHPEVGTNSGPAPTRFARSWSYEEFESTPGSLSSGANPEETSEMAGNEINQIARVSGVDEWLPSLGTFRTFVSQLAP